MQCKIIFINSAQQWITVNGELSWNTVIFSVKDFCYLTKTPLLWNVWFSAFAPVAPVGSSERMHFCGCALVWGSVAVPGTDSQMATNIIDIMNAETHSIHHMVAIWRNKQTETESKWIFVEANSTHSAVMCWPLALDLTNGFSMQHQCEMNTKPRSSKSNIIVIVYFIQCTCS